MILVVDDDPEVLGAVERDLRQHYRSDYRILKAASGPEALEAARQFKQRGAAVALFLVDERMPGMSGTDLLREVLKIYPDSRRVLLTAYADTSAAISGINEVGLDHYLLKPWDPPQERLYPVLDDLLSDWMARVRPPYDGIRLAGARSSPRSYAVKEFLSTNHVPYQWIDVDQDAPTRELIRTSGNPDRLPVIYFPDGTHLVAPTNQQLAEKIGLQTRAQKPFYDVVIIGGGPGGPGRRGLRRFGGPAHAGRRAKRAGRSGRHELAHRELPRIPLGRFRRGPRATRRNAGPPVRRRSAHAGDSFDLAAKTPTASSASPTAPTSPATPWSWRPESPCGRSTRRDWTRSSESACITAPR